MFPTSDVELHCVLLEGYRTMCFRCEQEMCLIVSCKSFAGMSVLWGLAHIPFNFIVTTILPQCSSGNNSLGVNVSSSK